MDSQAPSPLVLVRDLCRAYTTEAGQVFGVRDVSFSLPQGSLTLLKGASGSGKSTLLALLAGLDTPTSGTLAVAGVGLASASEAELTNYRRHTIGMVFQSFNLMPTLNVLENVRLPGLLAGADRLAILTRAKALLEELGLGHRLQHRPAQLSGGEMQRTAIARALINRPRLLLADEPTGNLDSASGSDVVSLLRRTCQRHGVTVVIATHSHDADHVADRTLRLKDGYLTDGPVADERPEAGA